MLRMVVAQLSVNRYCYHISYRNNSPTTYHSPHASSYFFVVSSLNNFNFLDLHYFHFH